MSGPGTDTRFTELSAFDAHSLDLRDDLLVSQVRGDRNPAVRPPCENDGHLIGSPGLGVRHPAHVVLGTSDGEPEQAVPSLTNLPGQAMGPLFPTSS